ncbi:MAG: hypothetical protein AB7O24_04295 [Kofleriaceae bacterium]
MGVRICALSVPLFSHAGLQVGERWMEVTSLPTAARDALRDYHGRFVRVHPDDRAKLAEIGLTFVANREPLRDLRSKTATDDKPDGGSRTKTNRSKNADASPGGARKD